jgi:hypothetical protein
MSRAGRRAGRKRQEGERYACGKLKPPAPNPKVVALRRAMLGREDLAPAALAAAENPLDLMLARGWIEERLHRAANAYAALHRRAGLEAPALRSGSFEKVSRAFDAALGDGSAMASLRELWAELRPAQAQALLEVSVRASWPEWVTFRLAGKEVPPFWDLRRIALMAGLETVAAVLRRERRR